MYFLYKIPTNQRQSWRLATLYLLAYPLRKLAFAPSKRISLSG